MERLRAGDPYQVGPYRLLGRIGSGGMGQVFLGVGPSREPVAVKLVHRAFAADPQFRARFRHEVVSAGRVAGPGTAPIVAADPDAPVPWLATAYVAGPALDRAVRETGPLPPPTLHALAAGLAVTLAAVHAAGLVHRDVKPPNVLLAADGPRLIDMGISRAADATRLSTTGGLVGTPAFMSPEQAEGHLAGPGSDVFALGAVLVYAALGRGPFGDANPLVLLRRIADDPPDLSGFTRPLREPVAACLAKHPAQRPTAARLAALLGPPPAPHPGAPPGAWLPASVAALIPPPPDLDPTEVGGLRHGPTQVARARHTLAGPPPAPARTSRRGLLAGAVATLGLAAVGGLGVATVLGAGGTPVAAPVPPAPATTPPPAPIARPAGASPRWTAPVPRPTSAIVSAGGTVYVGGGGTVVALDAATGRVLWQHRVEGDNATELAVADGLAFLAVNVAGVAALDTATGTVRWEASPATDGVVPNRPVVAGGAVVVLGRDDQVHALEAATGTPRWDRPDRTGGGGTVTTGPAAADGLVHAGSENGRVYAVEATSGDTRWVHVPPQGYNPVQVIAAAGDTAFVAGFDGRLTALVPG